MHILHLAFIQNLRAPEIILIFLAMLLFFGAKRLPELFRSFGKSIREFKKATSDIEDDIRTAMDEQTTNKADAPEQIQNVQKTSPLDEEDIESESESESESKS